MILVVPPLGAREGLGTRLSGHGLVLADLPVLTKLWRAMFQTVCDKLDLLLFRVSRTTLYSYWASGSEPT